MYGPRAFQVSRLLSRLPALGWQTTVVCLDPRRGGPHWRDGAGPSMPAGVDLVRVPSAEESLPFRIAARLSARLRDRPDRSWPWIAPATAAAVDIGKSDVAGVISFAQPWSDHLVGLGIRRKTRLPWVAHFSDPWTDSPYATVRQRSIWKPMEADVVHEASALVFVASETADLVMAKYPAALRAKVSIVPHGFEPCANARKIPVVQTSSDRKRPMRVVYTGRFYPGVRTPSPMLRALAEVDKKQPLTGVLQLMFIGPHVEEFRGEAVALGVDRFVTFKGQVPFAQAATAAEEADVLLVIDASTSGPSVFLPSKLIDYLAFRKPIIGLTPSSGASASLLARLGCAVAPPDDVPAIRALIEDLIARWTEGTLIVAPSFEAVAAEYDVRNTARRLDEVLTRAFA